MTNEIKEFIMTENEWDKLLNIKTSGRDDTDADTYRYPYEPTPYSVLERLAFEGYLGKNNTLLDYGCGKGRVGIFLSYQTKCHSIGIEYNQRIFTRAAENKEKSPASKRVQFVCEDATKYEVPEEVDSVFFFNPFSAEILQSVLARIFDSFYSCQRRIRLFFYYPSDEYVSCLMREPLLSFVDEIDCSDLFESKDNREKILIFEIEF